MKSDDIDQLVHLYVDGAFNRRELIRRVAGITGSTASATAALVALGVPEQASAQTAGGCPENARVPADAEDVESVFTDFQGQASKMFGYLSLPRKEFTGQMPGIVVIHENRGMNEHIKDVNRRLARAGYVALAVDLLSRWGGTDRYPDPNDAATAYRNVTAETALADVKSGVDYLRTLGVVRADRIGVLGFCAGGGHSWNLAVNQPDLSAAVVYYGTPATASIGSLQAPILLHYAELDRNFTGQVAGALTELVNQRKPFALHVWRGAGHAFNNDTGANYNAEAACQAWKITLDFLARTLRA